MNEFPLHKRIENQIKSYFTNLEKINFIIDESIKILVIDENNVDPPSIEIKQIKENYELHFWDGYSQSEVVENLKEREITKSLRRFLKKINKYLDAS
jgi:hypothetical protein|tara:strand:- start:742 stop:1032 length:291 start_codon:yes stop_codon:yes gene_type:complete